MFSEEVNFKLNKVRSFMKDFNLDVAILSKRRNLSWLMGGGDFHVVESFEDAVASIIVGKDDAYLITFNNEVDRFYDEEIKGEIKSIVKYWYENDIKQKAVEYAESVGKRVCADFYHEKVAYAEPQFSELRISLTPWEIERYKQLGSTAGNLLTKLCQDIKRGMTENEAAGLFLKEFSSRGVRLPVVLIASDERVYKYRHPLPKDKRMEKQVAVSIVAEKWGLHASMTRIIHFGAPSTKLENKHVAVTKVDAALISSTRPGSLASDIFRRGLEAYSEVRHPDEWRKHHQGGWAGYLPREIIVTQNTRKEVGRGQAFAWNPTITGTKSEDTILVFEEPNIITEDKSWPSITVEVDGWRIERPAILVK